MKLNVGSSNQKMSDVKNLIEKITWRFPDVKAKLMFGCDAYFYEQHMFAILWKNGRVGIKLDDKKQYKTLTEKSGAEPWIMGSVNMENWVLLPASMNNSAEDLFHWIKAAYESVGGKSDLKALPQEKKPAVTKASPKVTAKLEETPKKGSMQQASKRDKTDLDASTGGKTKEKTAGNMKKVLTPQRKTVAKTDQKKATPKAALAKKPTKAAKTALKKKSAPKKKAK